MKTFRKLVGLVVLALGVSLVSGQVPAYANHTLPLQPTRTIVYQYMTGKVPTAWQVILNDRLHYLDTIPGHPIDVVQGTCQLHFTCVRIYAEPYGYGMTRLGQVTYPSFTCGPYYCPYDGTAGTWNTLQINTTRADSLPSAQKYATGCHEIGHTVKLQHAGGVTCMQATVDDSPLNSIDHYLNTGSTVDTNEELELYDMYVNGGVPYYGAA